MALESEEEEYIYFVVYLMSKCCAPVIKALRKPRGRNHLEHGSMVVRPGGWLPFVASPPLPPPPRHRWSQTVLSYTECKAFQFTREGRHSSI